MTSRLSRLSGLNKISVVPYEEVTYELGLSNVQYFSDVRLQEYISSIPQHPNVLNPYNCILVSQQATSAFYKVSKQGMTLYDFVQSKKLKQKTIADIILQIIDGYNFLIKNRLILSECSINPKYIWVEYNKHGKLGVYIFNTLEHLSTNNFGTVAYDKKYWSPELTNRYSNYLSMSTDIKTVNTPKMRRTNTCVSNISCVYSIGLIIYFITSRQEPLTININRPILTSIVNEDFHDCIFLSTEERVDDRISIDELKSRVLVISLDIDLDGKCCSIS